MEKMLPDDLKKIPQMLDLCLCCPLETKFEAESACLLGHRVVEGFFKKTTKKFLLLKFFKNKFNGGYFAYDWELIVSL